MTYAVAKQQFNQPSKSNWIPKPLNRTGDLDSWKREMKIVCPNPVIGEIVFLNKSYFSREEQDMIYERVGYKALKVLDNGEAIWQRGKVVRIEKEEQNYWY